MPRSGAYVRRGEPVVLHDAVSSLPAPLASAAANLPDEARRHAGYAIEISADGSQELTGVFLWSRVGGAIRRLLGQPNGGSPIVLAAGLGVVFDIEGAEWEGLYLQATLSTGALVTVTATPVFVEGD